MDDKTSHPTAIEDQLDRKLEDTLARLRSFPGEDPEQAAEEFAHSEVTFEDPLRARRAEADRGQQP
jgi:hypothetical protein